uniref:Putative receptor-like protein kinase At1g67000 n=1 Tax=Rhizophora mucronata TaxID=61149 RepID=A0A2P2J6J4_RHIMU
MHELHWSLLLCHCNPNPSSKIFVILLDNAEAVVSRTGTLIL